MRQNLRQPARLRAHVHRVENIWHCQKNAGRVVPPAGQPTGRELAMTARVPKLYQHKASGRAYATLDDQQVLFSR